MLSTIKEKFGKKAKFLFAVAGVLWVLLAYFSFTYLLVWPAAACFLSSAFLAFVPSSRFSYSLAAATSLYGVMISVLQIYFSFLLLSSALVELGSISIALFSVIGIFHFFLFLVSRP